jgi:hypothetical protein
LGEELKKGDGCDERRERTAKVFHDGLFRNCLALSESKGTNSTLQHFGHSLWRLVKRQIEYRMPSRIKGNQINAVNQSPSSMMKLPFTTDFGLIVSRHRVQRNRLPAEAENSSSIIHFLISHGEKK